MSCVTREKLRRAMAALRTTAAALAVELDEAERDIDAAITTELEQGELKRAQVPPSRLKPHIAAHWRHNRQWERIELLALRITIVKRSLKELSEPLAALRQLYTGPMIDLPDSYENGNASQPRSKTRNRRG